VNTRAGNQARSSHGALTALERGVSVVVPCYRSEGMLAALAQRIAEVLPRCAGRYELILVNDGSEDGTWKSIVELASRHPWIRGIDLLRNYGQHNATLCGTRAARYDVTVTLDDDLQNPPEEIPKLLAKLDEGYDLVYGTPTRRSHSPLRYLASWLARGAIDMASGPSSIRSVSAFRAFRTGIRQAFADYRSPQVILDVLLGWSTTRVASVVVGHDPRAAGTSNYGFVRLWGTLLLLWTGYTTAPLRLASWLGFTFVLFGVGILCYVLGIYWVEGSLPGFPFLASTIAIFGGVQLFALGIIGEYLARLFNRSLDRPTYSVRSEVSSEVADGRAAEAIAPGPPR